LAFFPEYRKLENPRPTVKQMVEPHQQVKLAGLKNVFRIMPSHVIEPSPKNCTLG